MTLQQPPSCAGLDRRQFIVATAAVGGGLALGLSLAPAEAEAASVLPQPWTQPPAPGAVEFSPWVVIAPDDTVTVRVTTPDIGNGVMTQAAMTLTEELACDWSKVRADYVAPEANFARNRAWGDMSTGGSRGIRTSVPYVQKGGAAARMMLVSAAARRWGVPEGECATAASVITHTPSGRKLRYGEVAAEAAALPVPADPPLKPHSAWKIAGKGLKRLDTVEKLNQQLQED